MDNLENVVNRPRVGQMVHYVIITPDGTPLQCRPMVVTHVDEDGRVYGTVFSASFDAGFSTVIPVMLGPEEHVENPTDAQPSWHFAEGCKR